MKVLTIKTGTEQYSNRIYTSSFFLIPAKKGDEVILLTDHKSYTPHEEIICGLNGCFGKWRVGHVVLSNGARLFGVFTKKILAYDASYDVSNATHVLVQTVFSTPGKKITRYTQNYWGYNAGVEICELLSGHFRVEDEQRERYKLGVPLSKLPF